MVEDWPEEDVNLKSSSLEGEFVVGSKIVMQPTKGPKSTVKITECTPNKSFSTEGNIPAGKLIIDHNVGKEGDNTVFTHTIIVTGPLKGIFVKLVVGKLAENLPNKMQNIAELALKV